ncbi:MAG TPA: TraB/GumN family protein [Paracoccaceae bacterium]|nr:TraB/GumN family protein [Paracoccaceae bacterium]
MSRLKTALIAASLLAAAPAHAECRGRDYLAALATSAPAAAARLEAAVAAAPYAEGRFWRIEKEGRTSWAFGTFHSADPAITALPPEVQEALAASRLLMVEIAPDERARLGAILAADPGLVVDLSGAKLSASLAAGEMAELSALLKPYGITAATAETMRPWFLNLLLATPACELADLARGRPVLDEIVAEKAAGLGKPVRGLESAEAAMAVFRDFRPEDQLRLLRLNIAFGALGEEIAASMGRLYLEEDILRIWELNRLIAEELAGGADLQPMLDDFHRRALVERNRAWLERALPELEEGGVVIAVGALHLAGPDSLQAMLEARGYRVTRVALAR